jgi:hypothetical protein
MLGAHPERRSMSGTSTILWAIGLSAVLGTGSLSAHHSFAAEYDSNRPLTVTGTVTKLEWTNPHARVFIDAKDDSGKIVHWDFEPAEWPDAPRLEPELAQAGTRRDDYGLPLQDGSDRRQRPDSHACRWTPGIRGIVVRNGHA